MKIHPVRAELSMRTARQTDKQTVILKLIFAFRCFANAPKICVNLVRFLVKLTDSVQWTSRTLCEVSREKVGRLIYSDLSGAKYSQTFI